MREIFCMTFIKKFCFFCELEEKINEDIKLVEKKEDFIEDFEIVEKLEEKIEKK